MYYINQTQTKGIIMKGILILIIILMAPWIVNAYKFAHCDFTPDYKCEAIHAVGILVPPAALATVWFGTDEDS